MRTLLYTVILLAVLVLPTRGTDVGKLIPVEVIAVSESGGIVTIDTDTGERGSGNSVQAAIEDMKASAPGVIYLDTAEYLLLEEGTEDLMDAMRRHIKGSVSVCYGAEGIPLDGIADFLSVHKPDVKLRTVSNPDEILRIAEENGRYWLAEK